MSSRIRFFLVVFLVLGIPRAFAADAPPPERGSFLITADVARLLFGSLAVETRGRISPRLQWVAGLDAGFSAARYRSAWTGPYPSDASSTSASQSASVGAELGVNVFVLGRAPTGLWVGPRINADATLSSGTSSSPSSSSMTADYTSRATGVGGTVLLGYTHVFGSGFTLELAAGPGAEFSLEKVADRVAPGTGRISSSSFGVRTWVGIGYAL